MIIRWRLLLQVFMCVLCASRKSLRSSKQFVCTYRPHSLVMYLLLTTLLAAMFSFSAWRLNILGEEALWEIVVDLLLKQCCFCMGARLKEYCCRFQNNFLDFARRTQRDPYTSIIWAESLIVRFHRNAHTSLYSYHLEILLLENQSLGSWYSCIRDIWRGIILTVTCSRTPICPHPIIFHAGLLLKLCRAFLSVGLYNGFKLSVLGQEWGMRMYTWSVNGSFFNNRQGTRIIREGFFCPHMEYIVPGYSK